MRLVVDAPSLADTAVVFERANQSAAAFHDALSSSLAGTGGMAGDSAPSATFASAYDPAAAAALGALADLCTAFATCGGLATTSLHHHARAEARSVVSGLTVYEGSVPTRGYVSVLPATPPSALGPDSSAVPSWATWVLDQVEGFVWPDGDPDRLRSAARAWSRASSSVLDLTGCCSTAVASLSLSESPEIPVAVEVTERLAGHCRTVAEQCAVLASACDDYADHIEQQRAAVLDLVHDLLRDAVLIEGIGLFLGVFTAGTTTAGATAINAARIATAAPRLMRIVETLRALVAATAAPLRLATTSLTQVRRDLEVFARARRTLAWTYDAERLGRVERLRGILRHPHLWKPEDLRGLSRDQLADAMRGWNSHPSSRASGTVYDVPGRYGNKIRVMDGYVDGNRAEELTHGPYAVLSFGNGRPIKVPLEGNPVL